jgi:hypothetical protein
MVRWGQPKMMRFDNGHPWGTSASVPSPLALWLVGLGIQLRFGRPRQSTDNAVVERAHGVLNGWVEPSPCADGHHLRRTLDHFATLQRERYPLADGTTRLAKYPALTTGLRPYHPAADDRSWSLQRVVDYLATFRFYRKVEVNGRFTLLNQRYSVGRHYQRRTLAVQLDAGTQEWVVYDDDGRELRRFALTLTYAALTGPALDLLQSDSS